MRSLARAERRIAEVIAGSDVPEDPVHSRNTLKWLLQLAPRADAALRIAALGHDIERAVEERKVRRADFAEYDAFKAAHAREAAPEPSESDGLAAARGRSPAGAAACPTWAAWAT